MGRYGDAIGRGRRFGEALWLAPTHRAAEEIRGGLIVQGLSACLAPNCLTFAQFAEAVIAAANVFMRPLDTLEKRQIVRGLIQRAIDSQQLRYFRPIAQSDGLVDLVCDLLGDLKRQRFGPTSCIRFASSGAAIEKITSWPTSTSSTRRCSTSIIYMTGGGPILVRPRSVAAGSLGRVFQSGLSHRGRICRLYSHAARNPGTLASSHRGNVHFLAGGKTAEATCSTNPATRYSARTTPGGVRAENNRACFLESGPVGRLRRRLAISKQPCSVTRDKSSRLRRRRVEIWRRRDSWARSSVSANDQTTTFGRRDRRCGTTDRTE